MKKINVTEELSCAMLMLTNSCLKVHQVSVQPAVQLVSARQGVQLVCVLPVPLIRILTATVILTVGSVLYQVGLYIDENKSD